MSNAIARILNAKWSFTLLDSQLVNDHHRDSNLIWATVLWSVFSCFFFLLYIIFLFCCQTYILVYYIHFAKPQWPKFMQKRYKQKKRYKKKKKRNAEVFENCTNLKIIYKQHTNVCLILRSVFVGCLNLNLSPNLGLQKKKNVDNIRKYWIFLGELLLKRFLALWFFKSQYQLLSNHTQSYQ